MTCTVLPLTDDPWQVFTVDLSIDGEPFHAQAELRYLEAPDQWFLSLRDQSNGELLVHMIPLICSYGQVNDLLAPFRHLRDGRGLGSLFCIRNTDAPATPDPSEQNLNEFRILFGDTFDD